LIKLDSYYAISKFEENKSIDIINIHNSYIEKTIDLHLEPFDKNPLSYVYNLEVD
jgi:hypothetical protein